MEGKRSERTRELVEEAEKKREHGKRRRTSCEALKYLPDKCQERYEGSFWRWCQHSGGRADKGSRASVNERSQADRHTMPVPASVAKWKMLHYRIKTSKILFLRAFWEENILRDPYCRFKVSKGNEWQLWNYLISCFFLIEQLTKLCHKYDNYRLPGNTGASYCTHRNLKPTDLFTLQISVLQPKSWLVMQTLCSQVNCWTRLQVHLSPTCSHAGCSPVSTLVPNATNAGTSIGSILPGLKRAFGNVVKGG